MLRSTSFPTFSIFTLIILLNSCGTSGNKEVTEAPVLDSAQLVARGEYLVGAMGCDDCHSPKKMGAQGPELVQELRLSGWPSGRPVMKVDTTSLKLGWILFGPDLTAQVGPWGMSFSANITGDPTGIGSWKEEQFFVALREGKAKGLKDGRPLAPPMPWMNYKNLSDDDLRAIFYFLKSVPAVNNVVPPPVPATSL